MQPEEWGIDGMKLKDTCARMGYGRFLLAVLSLFLTGSMHPAHAGAYTHPKGRGQAIATTTFISGERYFDAAGRLVPVAEYRKFELSVLAEYGATDWLTLLVQPALVSTSIAQPVDADHTGFGHMEAGARLRLLKRGGNILSVQASVRAPGTSGSHDPARLGLTDTQADARLLYMRAFTFGKWNGFLDFQSGYRHRSGSLSDEIRLDVTVGIRPSAKLLVMGQSFHVLAIYPDDGAFTNMTQHKLQTSLVYDMTDSWSVQLGAVATVSGANSLNERGLIAAVWRRF